MKCTERSTLRNLMMGNRVAPCEVLDEHEWRGHDREEQSGHGWLHEPSVRVQDVHAVRCENELDLLVE